MSFLDRFVRKRFFWSKTEKVNTTYFRHNSTYSNYSTAKFQFKLTILISWTKFTQKSYFQLKAEQAVQGLQAFVFCVVNINSAVVFKHLKISKISLFWTLVKSKWLVNSWLNFNLNLSFKFFYNFTGQLNGNGQKFWQVPPSL